MDILLFSATLFVILGFVYFALFHSSSIGFPAASKFMFIMAALCLLIFLLKPALDQFSDRLWLHSDKAVTLTIDGVSYKCIPGEKTDFKTGDKYVYEAIDGTHILAEVVYVKDGLVFSDPGGHDPEWPFYQGHKFENILKVIDAETNDNSEE